MCGGAPDPQPIPAPPPAPPPPAPPALDTLSTDAVKKKQNGIAGGSQGRNALRIDRTDANMGASGGSLNIPK